MEKTPRGTSVGVDDPYAHVDRCDHVTDDGRCRLAAEQPGRDPEFAAERQADDLRCPAADPDSEARCASTSASGEREDERGEAERSTASEQPSGRSPRGSESSERRAGGAREQSDPRAGDREWADCPHFRCRNHDRECARCGLAERRMAHSGERPLLEEHHLEYPDDDSRELAHEVTVFLCRWCHAKVHGSWARVDDDVAPDPEAVAEAEGRKTRELEETGFESAADRFDRDG